MYDYNTRREAIILREYGRNIQKLIKHVTSLDNKDQRNNLSQALLKIMKSINPKVRNVSEDNRKLWDDLFIISDYHLDIEAPYPVPEKDILNRKISRLDYKTEPVKFRHYGRNVELLLYNAVQESNEEIKLKIIKASMRIMRSFHVTKNSDGSDIDQIILNVKEVLKDKADSIDFDSIKNDMLKPKSNGKSKYRNGQTYQKNK